MPILFYPEWAAETVNNLGITPVDEYSFAFLRPKGTRDIGRFFCCPPEYSFRLYKCEIITYKIAFCPVDGAPTMHYKNDFFSLLKPTAEPHNSSLKYNALSDLNFCSRNNICLRACLIYDSQLELNTIDKLSFLYSGKTKRCQWYQQLVAYQ